MKILTAVCVMALLVIASYAWADAPKRVKFTWSGGEAVAELNGSQSAESLWAMLPVTVDFKDFNGVERIGYTEKEARHRRFQRFQRRRAYRLHGERAVGGGRARELHAGRRNPRALRAVGQPLGILQAVPRVARTRAARPLRRRRGQNFDARQGRAHRARGVARGA